MIILSDMRLSPDFKATEVRKKLSKERIPEKADWQFRKLSLDARKKDDLHYIGQLEVSFPGEAAFMKANRNKHICFGQPKTYTRPVHGSLPLAHRPVIVGAGPAGLFAARLLAEEGYAPILLERGADVDQRTSDVESFWKGGALKPDSNVQFGEGGAGTFSDGKLNTQVKEKYGRIHQVLEWFVEAGADPEILYWNKPHIGTDVLKEVVKNIRRTIISAGGEVRFHSQVTGLVKAGDGSICGLEVREAGGRCYQLETENVIFAIGHSARDTFLMLKEAGVPMEAKAFAMGVRIEHPQEMIQAAQYGAGAPDSLPVADYKLTGKARNGRGVYSFCMCPGGQVVNASSEEERIAVNGMSRSARDGRNANSALVVTVRPEDFPGRDVLAGVALQRQLEHLAWETGEGNIPSQLLGDFRENKASKVLGEVEPDICGISRLGNLREVLPDYISEALLDCIPEFGRKIKGYDRADAVLSGVESRTSSPVRINRDDNYESRIKGLYPCGEGAGYAGGITSAAVDGIKVAEEIIRRFTSWNKVN